VAARCKKLGQRSAGGGWRGPEQRFGGFARSALAGPFAVSWPLHHALLGVVADRGRALQLMWE
jgi:hypothetical protein